MTGREAIDPAVGRHFDAHGIAKGYEFDQLANLNTLLTQGLDPNRSFHTAPLRLSDADESGAASALGAAGPYDTGGFIVYGYILMYLLQKVELWGY